MAANCPAPWRRMNGTQARVSTLLTIVGQPKSPEMAGKALAAFEGSEQGGLFAADVGAGATVDDDVEVEAGALDIFAEPALATGLVDGALEARGGAEILTTDVDVGFVAADSVGGDENAFDEGVGVPLEDVTVFE